MIEGPPKKFDFNTQFERDETLTIKGEEDESSETIVHLTEVFPSPEKIAHPIPLLIAEAFAHPKKTYEHALRTLYENGQHTLIFEHPRVGGNIALSDDERKAVEEFAENSPEEVRSALILLEVLDAKNLPQTNVISHSRGLAYVALAALIDDVRAKKEGRPNRIRNIVAYGSVGLIGEDSLMRLGKRTLSENFARLDWGGPHIPMEQLAREVAEERKEKVRLGELPPDTETDPVEVFKELSAKKAAAKERGIIEYGPPDEKGIATAKDAAARVGSEGAKHILGRLDNGVENERGVRSHLRRAVSGIRRTLAEVHGLSNVQLHDVLPKLRSMGIGIGVVRGSSDRVFPKDRVDEYVRELRKVGVLDVSITGVHDSIVQDPRVAHILDGILKQLEDDRERS